MTLDQLIQSMTPQIYENMKQAIELGRWPDGRQLDSEQKALCMEAAMLFEVQQDVPETQRIGYMESQCKSKSTDSDEQPLTIQSSPQNPAS